MPTITYTPGDSDDWATAPDDVAEALDALADDKLFSAGADDCEWSSADVGPILRSPDGTRFRVGLDDSGLLTTTEVS